MHHEPNHNCAICGNPFYANPARVKAKYCSVECRRIGVKKSLRPNRECPVCKTHFYAHPYEIEKGWAVHCSSRCFAVARTTRVARSCLYCGAEFTAQQSHVNKGEAKFCSRSCATKSKGKGDGTAHWMGGKIKLNCVRCGKEFSVFKYRIAENARFCSRKCSYESLAGENHPYWRGGISFEPYPSTFNNAFKRKIRERDSYTCIVCGDWGNCVHHVDYTKENTTSSNCVTTCRPCNARVNFEREFWERTIKLKMEEVGII